MTWESECWTLLRDFGHYVVACMLSFGLYWDCSFTHTYTHIVPQRDCDLLMMPLICESFSSCCCLSLLSLSSRRLWYCSRILLVCCSWECSLRSYSSSLRWDIISRSFREWISSSYSRTCTQTHTNNTLVSLHQAENNTYLSIKSCIPWEAC